MWTTLLTTILPYAFQIIAFVLQQVQANQATINAFQALVDASQQNGLITVQARDKFADLHQQLMDKFKT